jgi:hypothetical protein
MVPTIAPLVIETADQNNILIILVALSISLVLVSTPLPIYQVLPISALVPVSTLQQPPASGQPTYT